MTTEWWIVVVATLLLGALVLCTGCATEIPFNQHCTEGACYV